MIVETSDVVTNSTAKWTWAVPKVSMRSVLIAGVASLGIAAALPNGPVAPLADVARAVALDVAGPARVSNQAVELMAHIPVWSDILLVINQAAIAVDPVVASTVNLVAQVVSSIPVAGLLGPQINILYNYVIRPLIFVPLTCFTGFLGTFNPGYLASGVATIAESLALFLQAEIAYFLGGGWLPLLARTAVPFAAATAAGASLDLAENVDGSPGSAGVFSFGASGSDGATEFTAELGNNMVGDLADDLVAAELTQEAPVGEEPTQDVLPAEEVISVPVDDLELPPALEAPEDAVSEGDSAADIGAATDEATVSESNLEQSASDSIGEEEAEKSDVDAGEVSEGDGEATSAPVGRPLRSTAPNNDDSTDAAAGNRSASTGSGADRNAADSADGGDSGGQAA